MDKRTILFVLLVGATFLGVNIFFSKQRDQKNREVLAQQEALATKQKMEMQANVDKRTAKTQDLPLVNLSLDPSGQQVVAYGINSHGNTLTLAWTSPLPEKIYVNGVEQFLETKESVIGGPVVYGTANFSQLDIAVLPPTGAFDVQIVTFPKTGPKVYLGVYENEDVTIPIANPNENGLVVYNTGNEYLPLGFYESQGNLYIELQNLSILSPYLSQNAVRNLPSVTKPSEQRYYVLENDYLQLVFTNVGGALSEINLPFETESNQKSVVKEIGFDRQITQDYSKNAHFPSHAYYTAGSDQPHAEGKLGGYYPLLRRDIFNSQNVTISPQFYSLNIVSEYPEMAELVYEVKEFTNTKIVFEAIQPHRKITKTYSLVENGLQAPYCLNLSLKIEGDARGLWLTSGVPEVEIMSNNSSPQIQYRITRKGKSEVNKLDLPKPKELLNVSSVSPDWVVNSNGYLGVIMDPLSDIGTGYKATGLLGTTVPTRLSVIDPKYHPYPASKYPGYQVLLPIPSKGGTFNFRVYAGPFEENTLKTVDSIFSNPQTGYNPDYIACRTFYGWFSFISEPFAKILFVVMKFFHTLTHSWGFSIILLTVFLRILLYPLNAWSIKSMRRMQQISPQVQAIQQKYKKDPKKSQMEIMNLYREKKVNPFMGCVPILIQIPFLIGMFDLLKSSFQLRGASFIPGWIDNLTAPDVLFQWQRPIFFIGNQLHLLPILLGAVMFVQQKISSPAPKDPSQMTDQQRQQKAMGTIMTVVFTVMFYHFPSGLNLYWLSSMILGIVQQWVTNKVLDKHKEKEVEIIPQKKQEVKGKKGK